MAVPYPWWKRWLCYVTCEWFTKPVLGKRLCVVAYDILGVKKKVKRKLYGKDGGLMFFRLPKTIALIGLDHSGKSTHSKNISELLKNKNIRYKYLHLASIGPFNSLANKRASPKVMKNKNIISYLILSTIRQIFFLIKIIWVYAVILFWWMNGRIIICDRWLYDELIHIKYRKMAYIPNWVFMIFIFRPSRLFYMKRDPKKAFEKRKDEKEDLDYFMTKHKMYESLAKKAKPIGIKLSNRKIDTFKQISIVLEKDTSFLE